MKLLTLRIASSFLPLALVALLLVGCGSDKPKAGKAPDPAFAKLIADYPLETCVVTNVKLGDHGDPHDVLHEGKLVRFCCSSCVKEFNVEPAKYVAMIDGARAGQATAPK